MEGLRLPSFFGIPSALWNLAWGKQCQLLGSEGRAFLWFLADRCWYEDFLQRDGEAGLVPPIQRVHGARVFLASISLHKLLTVV